MCLAVPMKLLRIGEDGMATAELEGSRIEVDLSLVEQPKPGDYVIVHAGYAIEKLDEQAAAEQLALLREISEIWREPPMEHEMAAVNAHGCTTGADGSRARGARQERL